MMGLGIMFTGRSIVLSLIIGCLVMLFAFAYNVLMSSTFKLNGGIYSQAAMLQPKLLIGVSGNNERNHEHGYSNCMLLLLCSMLRKYFRELHLITKIIAIGIQTLFFLSTLRGSKFMAIINKIMVLILGISLTVFIIVGLPKVAPGAFAFGDPDYFMGGRSGFFAAVSFMGFACMGTTAPIALTADAKNPKKTVPMAILLTTIVIAVIYGLMAIVSAGILPIEEVAGVSLSAVAKEVFSYPVFVIFILGGACFSILTSLYGVIAMLRYPILATIEDGWLPQALASKTKKGYPWVVMIIMYLVAIAPIIIGMGLDTIISYLMIPLMVMNALNNILFLRIPKKYPEAWKKKLPAYAKRVVMDNSCNCCRM